MNAHLHCKMRMVMVTHRLIIKICEGISPIRFGYAMRQVSHISNVCCIIPPARKLQ